MEILALEHLTFYYPNRSKPAIDDLSLSVQQGAFIALCGKSGCGKSTLLRHLKPDLTPHGRREGRILFEGIRLEDLDRRRQAAEIGYVLQSPDNQIVTDKVWHELAFGLESLGMDTPEIRLRVAEVANFFGIQDWFHKKVSELSGGQKQLLNLASIMAMQPKVLVLDEPTSQLDPIAAAEFLSTIGKINRELGVSVVLTEHRLEEVLPMADRVVVMDSGKIVTSGTPAAVGETLRSGKHEMFFAMPTPMRVYARIENSEPCPVTVREGRDFLGALVRGGAVVDKDALEKPDAEAINVLNAVNTVNALNCANPADGTSSALHMKRPDQSMKPQPVVQLDEVWFRYEKEEPDVVKGLSMKVFAREFYAVVGGNGAGKTTMLSLISGMKKPYRGTVSIEGKKVAGISDARKFDGLLGVLPQNPQAIFVRKTVREDLFEMLAEKREMQKAEKEARVREAVELCLLEELLDSHPYDLSGGEQQRAALAKILLLKPSILLLDEPTKGLDAYFKQKFAQILRNLRKSGVTVIMVSHDIEFCAKYADRCAMFFDGMIVSEGKPRDFFAGNSFYTTSANRMARDILPTAVTANDIIAAFGGEREELFSVEPAATVMGSKDGGVQDELFSVEPAATAAMPEDSHGNQSPGEPNASGGETEKRRLKKNKRPLSGAEGEDRWKIGTIEQTAEGERKLTKRTLIAALLILFTIPLTMAVGIYYLNDRRYYFISVMIILQILVPFLMVFEKRGPQAKELVVIAVLCAIAVTGRMAFFMLPQVKPLMAIVIITGVCFGGEAGFLAGAVSAFFSNYFFGQGPNTPYQMFAFGIIGFLAGVLFKKGFLLRNRIAICIYGGFTTFVIYGLIMNTSAVLTMQPNPTVEMFIASILVGVPFDLIHAVSTVIFLYLIAKPMLEKLDRIKEKYGLLES